MSKLTRWRLLCGSLFPWAAGSAYAGPPFNTDDPGTVGYRNLEAFLFAEGNIFGETSEFTPGFELSYGALPRTQISARIPIAFEQAPNAPGFTPGPLGLGAKYILVDESETGWRPQASFSPTIDIPLTEHSGDLGVFLPVWLQKSFGDWALFGGGGYRHDTGTGDRWEYGIAIMRPVTPSLEFGVEAFGEKPTAWNKKSSANLGVGAIWSLNDEIAFTGSINRGVTGAEAANAWSFFFGIRYKR